MRENDAGTNGVMPEAENAWFFFEVFGRRLRPQAKDFFYFFHLSDRCLAKDVAGMYKIPVQWAKLLIFEQFLSRVKFAAVFSSLWHEPREGNFYSLVLGLSQITLFPD